MSLRLRNLLRSTRLQIKERSYAQLRLFSQGSNSAVSYTHLDVYKRQVVELLEKLMRDREGKIGCFIYELDYGRDYRPGGEGDFGEEGNLASAGSLYDHLAANYRRNAGNCEKWRGEDGETDQLSGD